MEKKEGSSPRSSKVSQHHKKISHHLEKAHAILAKIASNTPKKPSREK